jgi:hypothetical protein
MTTILETRHMASGGRSTQAIEASVMIRLTARTQRPHRMLQSSQS